MKRNGIFHVRLVDFRYIPVPGVNVNESFAPVINYVRFKIFLIENLVKDMNATTINIETVFHGNLDEEIDVGVPCHLIWK
jgi:hypothetical protein